jgi:CheY-like chemotaxis protein
MSRILIVEDDPAILCGLKDNLEFESHQVFMATDGEAGYRSLCENSPELVILDLMLPKLNGYDLCRRARGEGFSSPILMLSARSVEADRVLGLDLGANDYVTKPFSLRELLARVRALLRHEQEHQVDQERLEEEIRMASRVQQELFPRDLSPGCRDRLRGNLPAGPRRERRLLRLSGARSGKAGIAARRCIGKGNLRGAAGSVAARRCPRACSGGRGELRRADREGQQRAVRDDHAGKVRDRVLWYLLNKSRLAAFFPGVFAPTALS